MLIELKYINLTSFLFYAKIMAAQSCVVREMYFLFPPYPFFFTFKLIVVVLIDFAV